MYRLTLTSDERLAIDWVGYRYSHGDDLYLALMEAVQDPDVNWDFPGPITFIMCESTAWKIRDIGEDCQYKWDCFAPALADKLTEFCDKIV